MRAQPGVRRRWSPFLALALSGVLLGGCTSESPAPRPAGPTVVPLQQVDLSGVAAVRAPFCEALDPTALETALGGTPSDRSSYGPGDRVNVTPAVRDVAHEYSCTFRAGGVTARAWLFAPPVTRRQARSYLAARRTVPGCAATGVLHFGSPGLVQLCRAVPHHPAPGGAGPRTRLVTMSGLFGSGWLTCRLSAKTRTHLGDDELETRAQRWCASVATTVGTP